MRRGETSSVLNAIVLFSEHYGELKELQTCRYSLVSVGSVLAAIQDGLHGIRHYVPEGVPLLGVGNVTEDGIDLSDANYITPEEQQRLSASQVRRGDLLVTITGRLGTASLYDSDAPANLSAHVALCRPNPDFELLYLKYFFASRFGSASLSKAQIGSTHPHINVRRLAELPMPLPPLEKQRELVSAMEAARVARRAKLAEADALLSSLDGYLLDLLELVPPQSLRKTFAIRANQLTNALGAERYAGLQLEQALPWVGTVADAAELIEARTIPSREGAAEDWDWIRIDDLPNQPWQVETLRTAPGAEIEGAFYPVQEDDILLARLGPTILNAKFVLAPMPARQTIASPEFLVLRCKEGWEPDVVLWLLRTKLLRDVMYLRSRGGTPSRYRLDGADLLSIPFPSATDLPQSTIATEIRHRRKQARTLRVQAESDWAKTKRWFEEQLLGSVA